MFQIVHIEQKYLLSCIFFSFICSSAIAFELEFEPDPSRYTETKEDLLLPLRDKPLSKFSQYFPNVEVPSISLELKVLKGEDQNFVIDVFNGSGLLQEQIYSDQIQDIGDKSFWTEFTSGQIRVSLRAGVGDPVKIQVVGYSYQGDTGEFDGVVNWPPSFEAVSSLDENLRQALLPLMARVLVDTNSPKISNRELSRSKPCTGVLISESLLLTAAHCIDGQRTMCPQTFSIFGYFSGDESELDFRRCIRVEFLGRHIDVALLRLSAPSEAEAFPIPSNKLPKVDDELFVVQFPRGNSGRVSKDNACRVTGVGKPIKPYKDSADPDLIDKAGFYHQCDTMPGSSGAPIFSRSDIELVGIQQSQHSFEDQNIAVRGDLFKSCVNITDDQVNLVSKVGICEQLP